MRQRAYPVLLLAAAALSACGGGDSSSPAEVVATRQPSGPAITARMEQVAQWTAVSAEVATVDQAQAMARIPGLLTTLSVKAGDYVKKGQAIGRIVDSQLGYQGSAYAAQAAAAQAQVAQAQAELKRTRYLYENGVYAKARLEQAQAAAAAAQAQVRAAQAQQSAVGAVAGQGAVLAPATGRVLAADVPAGSAVAPGMVIATITSGPVVLRLDLPESLVGAVHAGSSVRIRTDDGQELTGQVSRIYPSVNGGQVRADAEVPGLDSGLIGRRIAAQVESGARQALLVPQEYVTTRYGIDYVTMRAKDGKQSGVPVQTAASGVAGKVEILSGVSAGDTLVKLAAGGTTE